MCAQDSSPSTAPADKAWYAVYTKHNHERKAADFLARKSTDDVFLPLYDSVRHWKDRKKSLSIPLFPGYFFLHSSLQNRIEILSTPGVFFIVESAGRACVIPQHEIEAIRAITQSELPFEPHPFLRTGEIVRICNGPLAGIKGIFLKPKNKYRVVVSIELLRKSVAIEVDLNNVARGGVTDQLSGVDRTNLDDFDGTLSAT